MKAREKRYKENPFLQATAELATLGTRRVCTAEDKSLVIVNTETGEFKGMAGFWHKQTVDKTQFIKVYAEGLGKIIGLKAPGRKVFQIIYDMLLERPGQQGVILNYEAMDEEKMKALKISRATFFKGINECINENIIAASLSISYYYINPAFIYNGNRIGLVQEFVLKAEKGEEIGEQIQIKKAEELAQIAAAQDKLEGGELDAGAKDGENPVKSVS